MELKDFAQKIISFILILSGIYQIFLSFNAIFFIYPQLVPSQRRFSYLTEMGLTDKALLLYATMIIDGIYGLGLLLKPSREVEIFHLVFGAVLAIVSIFFITKTPFTINPITEFVLNQLRR